MPTAAPAAPAAAPAAPAKPAAAPVSPAPPSRGSVAPPPEKDPSDWMGDVGEELEQLADETPKPAKTTRKPEKTSEKPPQTEGKPPGTEEEALETETPPAPEKPAEPAEDVTKMGARDLRKAYEGSQKKIREELQPKISKLEARVRELETSKPEENSALSEKYKSIERRNQELEAHMAFVDYEQSTDYQTKYFKPYVEAWERARSDLAELKVELPDGQSRPATDEDIRMLAALPLGDRQVKANAMFGDLSSYVMQHVAEIKRLSDAQLKALGDAKKNALAASAEKKRQMTEAHQTKLKLWDQANKELVDKYPVRFAPIEGDTEGNKALAAGQALVQVLFAPEDMTPAEVALLPKFARDEIAAKGGLSQQSTVRLHAIIKNKAAAYDRLSLRMKSLREELAEAKQALKEYEDSTPGGPGGGSPSAGGSSGGMFDDADAEIDKLAREGR